MKDWINPSDLAGSSTRTLLICKALQNIRELASPCDRSFNVEIFFESNFGITVTLAIIMG